MSKHGPCPDDVMAALITMLHQDERQGFVQLDNLVERFGKDPRLHFLKGSMLAGRRDYDAARKAMRRAIDLAPDFAIARFQLGFLLLTSGESWPALEVWGPLHGLPEGHYLLHFVRGLSHLTRDEFSDAIADLEQGIGANEENPALSNDMRLIIDEMRLKDLIGGDGSSEGREVSSAQLLLQQAALRSTRH